MEIEEVTVIITEEGDVTPFMEVFDDNGDEADEAVVEAIKTHLKKTGRLLGIMDLRDDNDTLVIINQDNSVYDVEGLIREKNPQEAQLIEVIRGALRMSHRRLGTAYVPVVEDLEECDCRH